jgi:hypothetical protein
MKHHAITAIGALTLSALLGGCASTVRSDVTSFQQWPARLADNGYAFAATPAPDDTLELRSYQNLVRAELSRIGLREAPEAPALLVSMRFQTTDLPLRVIEAIDPFFYPYGRFGPILAPRRSARSLWYGPYRTPFWGASPMTEESLVHNYQRQLHIEIKGAADQRRLFEVTVQNLSDELSTPALMPALVRSAFLGFPGASGGARRVEVKTE